MKEIRDKMIGTNKDPFMKSTLAASTAIAFILLLGIVFSVFSVVHLGYVPEWKTDVEHSHVADVWEDMTELKSKIDRTTILLMSDPKSTTSNVALTMPLRTGSMEMPFTGSSRSTGTVSLNTDTCNMTITPANGSERVINCGTISYNSNNNYYVDQVFKYENGALILAQKEQSVMKLYPMILISEVSNNSYSFSINAIEIRGLEDTLSSNSDCSVRLKDCSFISFYDSDKYENVNSFTLKIQTAHPDAWEAYFNETMTGAGLEKDKDYTLDLIGNDYMYYSFPKNGSDSSMKRLYVGKTSVNAELINGLN
jgi:Tfp pilus assembly protein PilE